MTEREWVKTAPVRDVDGYPDDDTTRPIKVLRIVAGVFEEARGVRIDVGHFDGASVREVRAWAQAKFGEAE
jgi:hypothetical protein